MTTNDLLAVIALCLVGTMVITTSIYMAVDMFRSRD